MPHGRRLTGGLPLLLAGVLTTCSGAAAAQDDAEPAPRIVQHGLSAGAMVITNGSTPRCPGLLQRALIAFAFSAEPEQPTPIADPAVALGGQLSLLRFEHDGKSASLPAPGISAVFDLPAVGYAVQATVLEVGIALP